MGIGQSLCLSFALYVPHARADDTDWLNIFVFVQSGQNIPFSGCFNAVVGEIVFGILIPSGRTWLTNVTIVSQHARYLKYSLPLRSPTKPEREATAYLHSITAGSYHTLLKRVLP